ncbi:MAG: hypothetical protein QNJ20_02620 [Paracoccaceae bacterium]|nr:hypothetical protein [Paracoccaceae bacterium]
MSDLLFAIGDWLSEKFKNNPILSRMITALAFILLASLILWDLFGAGGD